MAESESRTRAVLLSYFPMFIATLSLVTSIYNGYLNNLFVNLIQRNLPRAEYMRTCKEVIDAYFQVKLRATVISRNRAAAGANGAVNAATATRAMAAMTADEIEGANAVAKLAALGTYLANLRDDAIRARYTELSVAVDKAMNAAGHTPPGDVDKLFQSADGIFAELNGDCVKTALDRPM